MLVLWVIWKCVEKTVYSENTMHMFKKFSRKVSLPLSSILNEIKKNWLIFKSILFLSTWKTNTQRELSFICWLIPQMPTRAWPGWMQEPGTPSASPCGWQGLKYLSRHLTSQFALARSPIRGRVVGIGTGTPTWRVGVTNRRLNLQNSVPSSHKRSHVCVEFFNSNQMIPQVK